mgnify:CR=1 FL=1
MYIINIRKLKLNNYNSWIIIEEEISDLDHKKIILDVEMVLWIQMEELILIAMEIWTLAGTVLWLTPTMLKKLYKNFNS